MGRAALAELLARLGEPGGRGLAPEPIKAGMRRLKRALGARLLQGPADPAQVAAIAAAIETAAATVESQMTATRATTERATKATPGRSTSRAANAG